ncbi:hypothetical protein BJX63DRAFT_383353 [Aspergillus granulosus]|uniref:Uncharacterized protein n=1 Tax=Aspergillus granulosus TaxID=176169 RepID=A0ABR4HU48_9EURO
MDFPSSDRFSCLSNTTILTLSLILVRLRLRHLRKIYKRSSTPLRIKTETHRMCYYQPNAAGCTCVFLQLVQPCDSPNVQYYPSPNPAANPKPLVKVCENRFIAKGVGQRKCRKCLAPGQFQAQRLFSTPGSSLAMGAAAVGAVGPRGTGGVVGQGAIIGINGSGASNVVWENVRFGSTSGSGPRPRWVSSTALPPGKRRGGSLSRTLAAKRVSRPGPSSSPVAEAASSPITRSRLSSCSAAPSVKSALPPASVPPASVSPSLDMVGVDTALTPLAKVEGMFNVSKTEGAQGEGAKPQGSGDVAEEGIGEMMSLLMSPNSPTPLTPVPVEQVTVKEEEGHVDSAEHVDGHPRADSFFDDLDFEGGKDQVANSKAEQAEETKMEMEKNHKGFH